MPIKNQKKPPIKKASAKKSGVKKTGLAGRPGTYDPEDGWQPVYKPRPKPKPKG